MYNPFTDIIIERGWCVADAASGSNCLGRGLETDDPPDRWCVEKSEQVLWLHDASLEAVADFILTNSFEASAQCEAGAHLLAKPLAR